MRGWGFLASAAVAALLLTTMPAQAAAARARVRVTATDGPHAQAVAEALAGRIVGCATVVTSRGGDVDAEVDVYTAFLPIATGRLTGPTGFAVHAVQAEALALVTRAGDVQAVSTNLVLPAVSLWGGSWPGPWFHVSADPNIPLRLAAGLAPGVLKALGCEPERRAPKKAPEAPPVGPDPPGDR
jgi:hypothetical protein